MPTRLGLTSLTMLVIASMIGIGAFVSSGFAMESLGSPARILLAWGLCGAWALAGALAYGGLARRVPLSGGEYLYLSRLLHPSIGFLAGWISLVAGFTAPLAAMAKAFVQNALPMLEDPQLAGWAACGVITVACVCHSAGLSLGAWAQNSIVFIKVTFILLLIVWAALLTGSDDWQGGSLADRDTNMLPSTGADWISLAAAMSWISFSYAGFNAAIYVAGESQSARQSVPRAMWQATLIVTILYLALNAIFVYAAPPAAVLENKPAIASLAAHALGGAPMEMLMRSIIALAVLSSVFSMLLAGPRVYSQMADDGVMPTFLKQRQGVPRAAVIMQAVLSMIVVWSATQDQIIGYLGMTLSACSALAVAALWQSAKYQASTASNTDGDREFVAVEPIRWWESTAAIIYIVGTLVMLGAVLAQGQRRSELWAVAATFVLGLVVYGVWCWVAQRNVKEPLAESVRLGR